MAITGLYLVEEYVVAFHVSAISQDALHISSQNQSSTLRSFVLFSPSLAAELRPFSSVVLHSNRHSPALHLFCVVKVYTSCTVEGLTSFQHYLLAYSEKIAAIPYYPEHVSLFPSTDLQHRTIWHSIARTRLVIWRYELNLVLHLRSIVDNVDFSYRGFQTRIKPSFTNPVLATGI